MKRGEIWWADLAEPIGSEPGFRRPVVIVQSDVFNRSNINTVIVVTLTSNLNLVSSPGNVFLSKKKTNLNRDSIANASQLTAIDKRTLITKVSKLDDDTMLHVEDGIRLLLEI